MEQIAAGFRRKRMDQEAALGAICGRHGLRYPLVVLLGLILVPGRLPGFESLEADEIVGLRMALDAASVGVPLLEEDRLNLGLEELVIEPRRCANGVRARRNSANGDRSCQEHRPTNQHCSPPM